jgi:hypothetical protein
MQVVENIVKTLQMLRFIKEQLSLATQVWADFTDPHGDINCFDDIRNTRGRVKLNSIKGSFRELVNLEKTISSLVINCEVSARNVSTSRPCRECNLSLEQLKLGMGLESQFLNRENIRLSNESNRIQTLTHRVNLKTQRINLQTQELNQLNTKAALKTSRTTQTNVFVWLHLVPHSTPELTHSRWFSSPRRVW